MLKETACLVREGIVAEGCLVGIWKDGLAERERIDSRRWIWRARPCRILTKLPLVGRVARVLSWMFVVLKRFRRRPVGLINCHSLVALPLCVALKFATGAKLVYDTHELETETCGMGLFRTLVSKLLERLLAPTADMIIVVSPGIGEWYRKRYPRIPVHVVRNIPDVSAPSPTRSNYLREHFSLSRDDRVFLYVGVLGYGRAILLMLRAFARARPDRHLVLMGYGPLESEVRTFADQYANIHFHPAVASEDVVSYAAGADVGLCLIENVCLSYVITLANKLFEYLLAGIPVVASDFPAMKHILDECGAGWSIPVSEEALAEWINALEDGELLKKTAAAKAASELYSWKAEEEKLLGGYDALMASRASMAP